MTLGQQNVAQMVGVVGRAVQDLSTARKSKIIDALNLAYDEAVADYDWPELERADEIGQRKASDTDVKTLEANEKYVPLPWEAQNVTSITLNSPSYSKLEEVSVRELMEHAGSKPDTTGVPAFYAIWSQTAQWKKLASDSVLTVKSSSSGNDAPGGLDVRIRYRTSSGHVGRTVWEDITAGVYGTGVDTAGTAESGWPVEAVSLPVGWVGDLTIEDSGGTEIVAIDNAESPGTTAHSQYLTLSRPLVRVWPVPAQDYAGTVTWKRKPLPLTEDEDFPEIPVSGFLVNRAIAWLLQESGNPEEGILYDRKAELSLTRIRGAAPSLRRGLKPRHGNVLNATGIWVRWP